MDPKKLIELYKASPADATVAVLKLASTDAPAAKELLKSVASQDATAGATIVAAVKEHVANQRKAEAAKAQPLAKAAALVTDIQDGSDLASAAAEFVSLRGETPEVAAVVVAQVSEHDNYGAFNTAVTDVVTASVVRQVVAADYETAYNALKGMRDQLEGDAWLEVYSAACDADPAFAGMSRVYDRRDFMSQPVELAVASALELEDAGSEFATALISARSESDAEFANALVVARVNAIATASLEDLGKVDLGDENLFPAVAVRLNELADNDSDAVAGFVARAESDRGIGHALLDSLTDTAREAVQTRIAEVVEAEVVATAADITAASAEDRADVVAGNLAVHGTDFMGQVAAKLDGEVLETVSAQLTESGVSLAAKAEEMADEPTEEKPEEKSDETADEKKKPAKEDSKDVDHEALNAIRERLSRSEADIDTAIDGVSELTEAKPAFPGAAPPFKSDEEKEEEKKDGKEEEKKDDKAESKKDSKDESDKDETVKAESNEAETAEVVEAETAEVVEAESNEADTAEVVEAEATETVEAEVTAANSDDAVETQTQPEPMTIPLVNKAELDEIKSADLRWVLSDAKSSNPYYTIFAGKRPVGTLTLENAFPKNPGIMATMFKSAKFCKQQSQAIDRGFAAYCEAAKVELFVANIDTDNLRTEVAGEITQQLAVASAERMESQGELRSEMRKVVLAGYANGFYRGNALQDELTKFMMSYGIENPAQAAVDILSASIQPTIDQIDEHTDKLVGLTEESRGLFVEQVMQGNYNNVALARATAPAAPAAPATDVPMPSAAYNIPVTSAGSTKDDSALPTGGGFLAFMSSNK